MATPTEKRMVTGLFRDRDSAEEAYRSVADRGYSSDDVNLVMSDETRKRHFSETGPVETELGTKAAKGAGVGGTIGARSAPLPLRSRRSAPRSRSRVSAW